MQRLRITEKNSDYCAASYLALRIFYFKTNDIIYTIFILPKPKEGLVSLLIFNFYKVFFKKDSNNYLRSYMIWLFYGITNGTLVKYVCKIGAL